MFRIELQVSHFNKESYDRMYKIVTDALAEMKEVDNSIETFVEGWFNANVDGIEVPSLFSDIKPLSAKHFIPKDDGHS